MKRSERRILLVEDNPDYEELTLMALKDAGIPNPIDVVRDGVEAIEYLLGSAACSRDDDALPMVMLLDLQLPRLDGFQVLERIRAADRTRTLAVVILTSSNVDDDIIRSYELGANSYVRKPVEFTAFTSTVRQLAQYWLLLNQPAQ